VLHVARVGAADGIIDSMLFVLRSVRARVGGTRDAARSASRPGPRAATRPRRDGALEFLGQGLKLRLGGSAEAAWYARRIHVVTLVASRSGSRSATLRSLWI
jgi:hypothetical protein